MLLTTLTTDPSRSLFDWHEGFLEPDLKVVGGVREFPVPVHPINLVDWVRLLAQIPPRWSRVPVLLPSPSLPQPGVLLMPPPGFPALQRLDSLDRSSSEFHKRLEEVLRGEEYQKLVPNLQGDDLVWLINKLDSVRRHVGLPPSSLTPAQALGVPDPSGSASRKCRRELKTICSASGKLPTSYTISLNRLDFGGEALAAGGYGDVYKGTLSGLKGDPKTLNVCIKHVRVYTRDGKEKAAKVRC